MKYAVYVTTTISWGEKKRKKKKEERGGRQIPNKKLNSNLISKQEIRFNGFGGMGQKLYKTIFY